MEKNHVCPIHKNSKSVSEFWSFEYHGIRYTLFECKICFIGFYSPFPEINYEQHTNSIDSIRDYVHLNSNIEGLIANLLDNLPVEGYKSMIEIGCGYGFTIDFAKNILNIDAVGYEPSFYGKMGAKELAADIRSTYLTDEDVKQKKVDLIYLSEVLEHIEDPVRFIAMIKNGLNDNGVFILTTPNINRLTKNLNDPTELALLSPGAHTILFSSAGLKKILEQAGFKNIQIKEFGNSLLAVSTFTDRKWMDIANKNALLRQYYYNLLDRVNPSSLTYTGIIYRLFRNLIDHGDYNIAADLFKNYPFPTLPSLHEIEGIDSTTKCIELKPSNCSILSFYIGMLYLNHFSDFNSAAYYFKMSYLLCNLKLKYVPESSVLEFSTIWASKFHEALSFYHGNRFVEAAQQLNQIITFEPSVNSGTVPRPSSDLIEKALALREKIVNQL